MSIQRGKDQKVFAAVMQFLRRVAPGGSELKDHPWPGIQQGDDPQAAGQSSGEGGGQQPRPAPSVINHGHAHPTSGGIPTVVSYFGTAHPRGSPPPTLPHSGPSPGPTTPHQSVPPTLPHSGPFPGQGGIPGKAEGSVVVIGELGSGGGLAAIAAALAEQLHPQQSVLEQEELQPLYRFGVTADWTLRTGSMTMSGDTATIDAFAGSVPNTLLEYTGWTQFANRIEAGLTCATAKNVAMFLFITGTGATRCGYAAEYNGTGNMALYRIDNNVFTSIGGVLFAATLPWVMAYSINNGVHTFTVTSAAGPVGTINATDSTYTSGAVGVGQALGNKSGQQLSGFYVQLPTF